MLFKVSMRKLEVHIPQVHIMSDASGSWGCAAYWNGEWFQVAWSNHLEFEQAPIAAKEAVPILVAAAVWGKRWRRVTVCSHCDDEAVMASICGNHCKQLNMAHMLHCLSMIFLEANFGFVCSANHILEVNTGIVDALSRNRLDVLCTFAPQARADPTLVLRGLLEG